jgi:hypothetical protein
MGGGGDFVRNECYACCLRSHLLVVAMRMLIAHFFTGLSAHCLLAGVIGFGISCLVQSSPDKDSMNLGSAGLLLSSGFLALGGVAFLSTRMLMNNVAPRWFRPTFLQWLGVAGLMVIPTILLFGPTGEFHHHIGFGPYPYFYMVWNGEDPAHGSFQIVDGYEVWFRSDRFGLLFIVWLLILIAASSAVWKICQETLLAHSPQNENT